MTRLFASCLLLVIALTGFASGCDTVARDGGVRFVWKHPAPGFFLAPTEPLVEDGRAFVAFNDQFSAFDLDDGDLLWTSDVHLPTGFTAANILSDEHLVFLHDVTWIRAFDKRNGRTLWNTPISAEGALDIVPMARNSTHLFLGRRNEVVRVRKDTGALDARFDLRPLVPDGIEPSARWVKVSRDGTLLYVAMGYYVPERLASDGFVLSLDATTGARRWVFPVPQGTWTPPDGSPQPINVSPYGLDVDDDVVVFPGGQTVYALDRHTGAMRWSRYFPDDGFGAGATLAGDAVIVGSQQERVFCLDRATGEERWRRTVRGSLFGPFTVQDGRVYFNSSLFGEVWILDLRDGAVVWTGEPPGDNFRSPVGVGRDRMVVVGDENVYGLTLP